ncbi:Uncharacterised protein [Streptococcus pneumoniae]|nr:Uncharacterised protein [Streptococcus pneumoniae]
MKKMKYYEETSALLHEFSEENQKYFEELWESFNLAGFLYDPKFQVEVSHPKEIHLATCSPSIF